MPLGAVLGIAGSIAGGLFGASAADRAAQAAARERARLQRKLNSLETNRQEIINPYEGISDLSSYISNPFANLGVATKAAEIQIEESDIALATTLDTLRATGASAGGATALAQAALRSKRGVAANIEQQESNNETLRAQGQQTMQQQLRAEQMRLQQAGVAGEQFMFGTRENREMQELDRTAALLGAARQAEAQASADKTSAITGMVGSVASIAGAAFGPTT
jgi:flagellar biosynthesis regulator FlaF